MPVYPPPAAGGGGGSVTFYEEGAAVGTATLLNFVGAGVTATYSGGTVVATIPGGTAAGSIVFLDEGNTAGTATHLNVVGSGGTVAYSGGTATLTISGGSGANWAQDVNQSGTSFASWTAGSGTWSSNGTEIIQTDTAAASWRRAKYNTLVPLGFPWILEAEMFHVSTSGTERRVGIGLTDGTNSGGLAVQLKVGGNIIIDQDATTTIRTVTATIADSTWYKLRIVFGNGWASIYLDGTLLANVPFFRQNGWDDNAEFVSLLSYESSVKFRNIKTWTLSTGAPA